MMGGCDFRRAPSATRLALMSLPSSRRSPHWPRDPLRAITVFQQQRDPAHATLRRLVRCLDKADIPYAIVGGMAVYAHGHRRMTDDVDVLLNGVGFDEFRRLFVPKNYAQAPGRSRRFFDRTNG